MAQLKDIDLYHLRAEMVLTDNIHGASHKEMALKYGCSVDTIKRSLAYAVREGLVKQHENEILSRLVPLAVKVYEDKLKEGDAYVAKHVIDNLLKLGDRFEGREAAKEEISLSAYLQSKRQNIVHSKRKSDNDTNPPIDGEVLRSERVSDDEPSSPLRALSAPVDDSSEEDGSEGGD